MADKIQQIAQYLDSRGWTYQLDVENNCIQTGVKVEDADSNFWLLISLSQDGTYFQIVAPQLLTNLKDHIYKAVLFQTLLAISWENKIVRWEYDLINGEVRATIELPLEDAVLTQKQFDRCLDTLIYVVERVAMPRIIAVLLTGVDPGENELGEKLVLTLEEVLPTGSLTLLEQAITARKQRGLS